jgi:hypothetical protein
VNKTTEESRERGRLGREGGKEERKARKRRRLGREEA